MCHVDIVTNAESFARDFAKTFVSQASQDIGALKDIAKVGADKLSSFLKDMQR